MTITDYTVEQIGELLKQKDARMIRRCAVCDRLRQTKAYKLARASEGKEVKS